MSKAPDILTSTKYWGRIRRMVWPWRHRVGLLVGVSFLSGALEALFLVVVTRTALAIADGRNSTGLLAGWQFSITAALVIAGALLVARLLASLVGVMISTFLNVNISTSIRGDLNEAYLQASWATQQGEPVGRLQQLLTSFVREALELVTSLTNMVTAGLSLAALLVIAVAVDPVASLVVVGALIALGSLMTPIRVRIRARSQIAIRAQMEFAGAVSELGQLGLEMQTFGVRDRFVDTIKKLITIDSRASRRVNVLYAALPHLYTSLAFGALLLGLAVASLVGVGELSAIGAVMLVMLRSLSYGQQLQTALGSLMRSLPFLDVLDTTLATYRRQKAVGGDVIIDSIGPLQAKDVSFAYTSDRPALTDVSFCIQPGEIVGVIGPSGAGKSTLVQLLLGVREPNSGTITVGGVDLAAIDRTSWTQRVSFVAQEAQLITGTVAENIRFFRSDLDDAQVRAAAKAANVLTDIEAMPAGFETHLGERGTQVSGGQRQRLSIARALVNNPKLLILDEPTSSLDVQSEALIRESLTALRGEVMVVIIAHRMSTLDMCDRIMVVEGGHVVALDTPDALRRNSDFYRQALTLSGIA
jgi:ABC-type multidrug transport system fused ATPase/permease subunit